VKDRIYLDNNATTFVSPEVYTAMLQELQMPPSNPSSFHYYGQQAKSRLLKARECLAKHLGTYSQEIIFTSGGTESMNLLIFGFAHKNSPGHIITSNIEHACVESPIKELMNHGWQATFIKPGAAGSISIEDILANIRPDTKAIILGYANSETGVKNDIAAIAQIALQHRLAFFIDAVGIFGKDYFTLPQGVTGAGFSGHKFHGPKGTGFCVLKTPYKIDPLFQGGGQEFSIRSGTENLPGIMGLAKAVEMACSSIHDIESHMRSLREYFESELRIHLPDISINGQGQRVSNVSNISFPGVDGETLLIQLDMNLIAASLGSACSSGSLEPSKVLLGMGLSRERAKSSLRFSLSRYTTKKDLESALPIIIGSVKQLRSMN